MLGLKPELALNNSIQACCYDCFNASSREMTSLQGQSDVCSQGDVNKTIVYKQARTAQGEFFSQTQSG